MAKYCQVGTQNRSWMQRKSNSKQLHLTRSISFSTIKMQYLSVRKNSTQNRDNHPSQWRQMKNSCEKTNSKHRKRTKDQDKQLDKGRCRTSIQRGVKGNRWEQSSKQVRQLGDLLFKIRQEITQQTIAWWEKLFPNDIKCCFSGIPCPIIVAWAIGKLYYENEQ